MSSASGPAPRQHVIADDIATISAACATEFQKLAGSTILLTGATGFIGSALLQSLVAWNMAGHGRPIRAILPARSLSAAQEKYPELARAAGLTWVAWGDLPAATGEVTHVIHGASPADPAHYLQQPWQTMRDIVGMTEAVLAALRGRAMQSMLYLSSGAVYGKQPETMPAIPESFTGGPDLTDPRSCYAEAKRFSEMLCLTSGLPVVCGRLFAFLGPNQDLAGSFAVPDFIRQAKTTGRIVIKGDGTALRSYCYASELTIILWKLLCRGQPGTTYNVGGETPVSMKELADIIAGIIGNVVVEVQGKPTAAPASRYIPDISRLKSLYEPKINLEQALRRVLLSHQDQDEGEQT